MVATEPTQTWICQTFLMACPVATAQSDSAIGPCKILNAQTFQFVTHRQNRLSKLILFDIEI
jgi:hypothetical protein